MEKSFSKWDKKNIVASDEESFADDEIVEETHEEVIEGVIAAPHKHIESAIGDHEIINSQSDNHSAIKKIQHHLGIESSGHYDSATRQAVRNWQAANSCRPNGLVDIRTWRAMFG